MPRNTLEVSLLVVVRYSFVIFTGTKSNGTGDVESPLGFEFIDVGSMAVSPGFILTTNVSPVWISTVDSLRSIDTVF